MRNLASPPVPIQQSPTDLSDFAENLLIDAAPNSLTEATHKVLILTSFE